MQDDIHTISRRRVVDPSGSGSRAAVSNARQPPGNSHDQPHRSTSRAAIAPWYSLFNVASRGDVKAIQEQILTADYQSCAGYLPGECWGRETSIKVVSNFANTI